MIIGFKKQYCKWTLCDYEGFFYEKIYDAECTNIISGTIKKDEFKYCPYCGKKIEEVI